MAKVYGTLNDEKWLVAEVDNLLEAKALCKKAQKKAISYWKKRNYDFNNTTDPNWKCTKEQYPIYIVEE